MRALQSRVEVVNTGSQFAIEYWAVPKTNFPKGLPKNIAPSEVKAGDAPPKLNVDFDEYFVIDKQVSREVLGKKVWTVASYVNSAKSLTLRPATGGGPATGGETKKYKIKR